MIKSKLDVISIGFYIFIAGVMAGYAWAWYHFH